MIKVFYILILFIIINACSTNNKSKFWIKENQSKIVNKEELLFKDVSKLNKEFNKNIKISLKQSYQNYKYSENLSNNYKIQNFDGLFENKNKFKYKKINNLNVLSSNLLFTKKNNVIFFDKIGNIFALDTNLNLKWKKNYYNKKEKKIEPSLNFALTGENILVTDNMGYYYLIKSSNGEIIWKKKNNAAFNSNIKVKNKNFYAVDFNNVLKSFSIGNGSLNWEYKSENTLIKSKKKLSLVIDKDKVIFINTVGDINALDISNGNLIWQTTTQKTTIYQDSFSTNYSDLVSDEKNLFFSNDKNEFFSLNLSTGNITWKQNIKSIIRPTVIDNLVLTVSSNGFFVVLDKNKGNIIRSTSFKKNLNNLEKKIQVTGFIVAKNNIYLTISNGRILKINILNGGVEDIIKLDNSLISKPFIYKKKIYIISNNSIKNYN